ncbi:MAG: NAD(P)H-binding protein [Streptosporangiaceae bacterium]|jgi:putative NADH-flavin reductase
MRLTVIGASGGTGTEVTRQALEAGHEVVAVVRDPSKMLVPGAKVFRAAITNPDDLAPAMRDSDAVVSALGPRSGEPTGILVQGAKSTLTAMGETGVKRIVVVSASGFFVEEGEGLLVGKIAKPILRRVLRDNATDTREMESLVSASDTEWTIMRPSQLTNGPRRANYKTAVDRYAGARTSRANLADAILKALSDPDTIRHRIDVAN